MLTPHRHTDTAPSTPQPLGGGWEGTGGTRPLSEFPSAQPKCSEGIDFRREGTRAGEAPTTATVSFLGNPGVQGFSRGVQGSCLGAEATLLYAYRPAGLTPVLKMRPLFCRAS